MQREAAALEGAHGRARLHGGDDQPAVHESQLGDMRRGREGFLHRLGIAEMVVERDVVRHVVVKLRRAVAHGFFGRGDGGQRFDIEADRFGGVLGLQQRFGDDVSDRVADIADFAFCQRFAERLLHRRAVLVIERHDAFERPIAGEIGSRIDAEHARHFGRGRRIDGADHAMGDLAADDHRIGLPEEADVVGIVAFAPQQHGVFAARHRLSDGKFLNGQLVGRQFTRSATRRPL